MGSGIPDGNRGIGAPYAGITSAVIHLSDTTAAFFGVICGPLMALFGALVSDGYWERWYGSDGREGRLYAPVLRRLPRWAGRAFFIGTGVLLTLSGALLFALGRS
jgi:hypothetical protein